MTNSEQVSNQTINQSGLEPVGHAVLLLPYEPEFKRSLIAIPDTVLERTRMIETRAVVIAIGGNCWMKESRPRAAVGDKVLVSKYCGAILQGPLDGKTYRMVNDEDIYARITAEAIEQEKKRDIDADEAERFEQRIRNKVVETADE